MSLNDLLSAHDLAIFDTYAHRIHRYHHDFATDGTPIRTPILMEILDCLARRFLLPNLRYFEVSIDGESSDTHCFFLSPKLEEIKLTIDSDEDIYFLLPRLVRAVPALRSLILPDDAIPDDLLHLTRYFRDLRTLDTCNDLEISANSFLSKFPFAPYLTTLRANSITIIDDDILKGQRLDEPTIQFSALKGLVLRDIDPGALWLSELFTTTLFPNLQCLVLHASPHKDSDGGCSYASYKKGWTRLFASITSGKIPLQSLQILDNSSFKSRPTEDAGMKLSRLLESSTPSHSLTSLSIEAPLLQSLTDTSVRNLAQTFPHLTHLSLIPKISTGLAMITFQNLALLAQLLPKLSTLHICIDGTSASNPPKIPVLSHGLEMLAFGKSSKVGNAFVFGRHIFRIFPFATLDTSHGSLPLRGDVVVSAFEMMMGCREDEYERRFQRG